MQRRVSFIVQPRGGERRPRQALSGFTAVGRRHQCFAAWSRRPAGRRHPSANHGQGQHIDIAMIDATTATDDKIHYDLEASWETAPLRNEIYDLPTGRYSSPLILDCSSSGWWNWATSKTQAHHPIASTKRLPSDEKLPRRSCKAWKLKRPLMR